MRGLVLSVTLARWCCSPRAGRSAFCGFYVSGADAKLFNNATQVVLMREGTRTVLSMQNNYQGPPDELRDGRARCRSCCTKENVKTLPREVFDARRSARRAAARRVLGAGPLRVADARRGAA